MIHKTSTQVNELLLSYRFNEASKLILFNSLCVLYLDAYPNAYKYGLVNIAPVFIIA